MLRHGFQTLGLTRIWAEVHVPNLRSVALMSRLGFSPEGYGPQLEPYDGQLVSMLRFGLLRACFDAGR